MRDLIQRLSAQHVELEQALAGIRPRQFKTDEARTRLSRVRELFRAHVHTERRELYPILEQAAAENQRLAGQLRRLADDLEILTGLADGFVRKYESGEPGLIEFATDHGALLTILRTRLRREEELLFPLYEAVSLN